MSGGSTGVSRGGGGERAARHNERFSLRSRPEHAEGLGHPRNVIIHRHDSSGVVQRIGDGACGGGGVPRRCGARREGPFCCGAASVGGRDEAAEAVPSELRRESMWTCTPPLRTLPRGFFESPVPPY